MKLTLVLISIIASLTDYVCAAVIIRPVGSHQYSAGTIDQQFDLIGEQTSAAISDAELPIMHERKLHLVVFDEALAEFHHGHPVFEKGCRHVSFTLPIDGHYLAWAQGEIAGDADFSLPSSLDVSRGTAAWLIPASLGDHRSGASGNSVIKVDAGKIRAGQMAIL